MTSHSKKRAVAILLFISCTISGWLLFVIPEWQAGPTLKSVAQADSVMHRVLYEYEIPEAQIRSRTIRVDSTFSRTNYRITVPPSFSKTQFHIALQQQLTSLGIRLPAKVTFPEQDMTIHFYFEDRVFQSITIRSDDKRSAAVMPGHTGTIAMRIAGGRVLQPAAMPPFPGPANQHRPAS